MADPMKDLNETILKMAEEKKKKDKETWEKLSSLEKIEKLRQDIDKLKQMVYRRIHEHDQRIDNIEDYLDKLGLEQTFNTLCSQDNRIVSTEKINCKRKAEEVHTAILLVHRDGTTTVKCSAACYDCKWGSLEW